MKILPQRLCGSYGLLVLTLALTACKKEEPPVRDVQLAMRYDSSGMGRVNVQFGIGTSSYLATSPGPDVLTGTLAGGDNGILTASGRYRSGDRLYGYVRFLDITNPANGAPAMAGYMAAVCYLDQGNLGTKALVLRYEDYQKRPQKCYVDKEGKTNMVVEEEYIVP